MALNTKVLSGLVSGLLIVTLLFLFGADLIPEAQTAGDSLNASGVPLGGLVASDGVVFVLIMGALVLTVYKGFMGGK